MQLTVEQLEGLLNKAKKRGACKEVLDRLRRMTPDEVVGHPDAPIWAYWYAYCVIKGRWAEAEPIIMQDPRWVYYYAREVIKGRWLEAEPVIMQNPMWAYWYAFTIIERCWLEAEPVISQHPDWARLYAHNVIKGGVR